jgi:predicted membrane channel-forming protein YqfA (hemolysin III family)
MAQIYRIVFVLSWVLGMVGILAGVVVKLLLLEPRAHVTGHTLFLVAGTFFLCALATREMQRSAAP